MKGLYRKDISWTNRLHLTLFSFSSKDEAHDQMDNSKNHDKDLSKGTQVHLLNKLIFGSNLKETVQTWKKGRIKSTGDKLVIGFTLLFLKTILLLNHQSFLHRS